MYAAQPNGHGEMPEGAWLPRIVEAVRSRHPRRLAIHSNTQTASIHSAIACTSLHSLQHDVGCPHYRRSIPINLAATSLLDRSIITSPASARSQQQHHRSTTPPSTTITAPPP